MTRYRQLEKISDKKPFDLFVDERDYQTLAVDGFIGMGISAGQLTIGLYRSLPTILETTDSREARVIIGNVTMPTASALEMCKAVMQQLSQNSDAIGAQMEALRQSINEIEVINADD